jgi:hypothetical protein
VTTQARPGRRRKPGGNTAMLGEPWCRSYSFDQLPRPTGAERGFRLAASLSSIKRAQNPPDAGLSSMPRGLGGAFRKLRWLMSLAAPRVRGVEAFSLSVIVSSPD